MKEKQQKPPKPLAVARRRFQLQGHTQGPPRKVVTKKRSRRAPRQDLKAMREATKKKKAMAKLVTVTLYAKHGINGVVYGPGRVTLPLGLAQSFISQEQRIMQQERRLQQPEGYIIKMQPGGPRKIEVPVGRLDAYLGLDIFAMPV